MRTVGLMTLGCKVNTYDSEAVLEILEKNNYKIVDFDDVADVYIINTCAVTNQSGRKSRQMIRRAKRKNEEAIICVMGCLAQVDEDVLKEMPEIDLLLGTKERLDIAHYLDEVFSGETKNKEISNKVEALDKDEEYEPFEITEFADRQRAFIKVQDGCEQFCSYCIIPYARGPIRSRSVESIIREVDTLVDMGYEEIVLTGIHIASFGKDKGIENGLIELLKTLHEETRCKRFRLSSISPLAMTKDFLKALPSLDRLAHHFHLSLQSGSNSVLKRMNRKYTVEDYKKCTEDIRKIWPDVSFTTDIIVGFPLETEEEFMESWNFVREISFLDVHVFPYSRKEGTAAAKMEQIENAIKSERASKLAQIVKEERIKNMQAYLGTEAEVLFETSNDGYSTGYTGNYIPVLIKEEGIRDIQKVRLDRLEEVDGNDYIIAKL